MSAGAEMPAAVGAAPHGADATGGGAIERQRQFHGLDALRGLAAAVVVLFHAGFVYGCPKPPQGYLAVDLFFVMSGFIIAHRYDNDLAGGMGVRAFMGARLVRLYPLFLLGTLVGVLPSLLTLAAQGRHAAHALTHEAMVAALPAALLMLPSRALLPNLAVLYPLNFVSWSLALELLVNLAYAALFRRLNLPALALAVGFGFAGLCGCAVLLGTLEVGFEWPHAAGGIARVVFGFAAGVLLRRLTARGIVALPRVPWPVPPLLALVLLCTPPLVGGVLWELAGCTLVVPFIAAAAAGSEPPRRLHRLCATAGVYSYVVYSLHMPLVGLLLRGETRFGVDTGRQGPGAALAFTVLLVLACALAHHAYDRPVRRRLGRLLAGRRRVVAPDGMLSPSP